METNTYTNPDCIKFVQDMDAAGFEVEHYRGRFFYEGPAVRCDNIADAMSATTVRCQSDQMGRGVIVYPYAADKGE